MLGLYVFTDDVEGTARQLVPSTYLRDQQDCAEQLYRANRAAERQTFSIRLGQRALIEF